MRIQHIEIRIGHAQQQVLIGLLQLHFHIGNDQLGLFVVLPAAPIKQRLGQRQVPDAASAAIRHAQALRAARFLVGATGFRRDQRQQQRTGLGFFFQPGAIVGAGGGVGGVIAQRGLPDLDQVLRERG
ncbi:hypothetical protein D3C73_1187020 [compost metagenome]